MFKQKTAIISGMHCEAPEGDYFLTCPFDSNHILISSKMPYHITKCKKNHPNHDKLQCPYNALEYIDRSEFSNHLLVCEYRRSVEDEKYEIARLKATGQFCNVQPVSHHKENYQEEPEEDWAKPQEKEVPDDPNDFNEDIFDNTRSVGRACGYRGRGRGKPEPKIGVGRAEILKRVYANHSQISPGSSSLKSRMLSLESDPRRAVCKGQFEDN